MNRESFLHAIRERPEDDTPRLIFADWAEDHDDSARAEFLRVQVELARLPAHDLAVPALRLREQALLAANQKRWLGPVREWVERWAFRRGFLEAVTLSASAFLGCAAQLLERDPIREVDLGEVLLDHPASLSALARSPHLLGLEVLRLRCASQQPDPQLPRQALRELLSSPGLTGLRSLRADTSDAEVEVLAGNPALANLAGLTLVHKHLNPACTSALVRSPNFPNLTRLEIRTHPPASQILARAPLLGQLEELNWGGLGQAEIRQAAGVLSDRLRRLFLVHNRLGQAGATILADSSALVGLEVLDLRANGLGPEGLAALLNSPHLSHLHGLHLQENSLGVRGIHTLSRWKHAGRLRELSLSLNGIRTGLRHLADSSALTGLRVLHLVKNDLLDDTVCQLVNAQHLSELHTLNLAENRHLGARWLAGAASSKLANLQELSLASCNVGDEGAEVLAHADCLGRLLTLRLDSAQLSARGLGHLIDSPNLGRLAVLSLSWNSFGRAGIPALAGSHLLSQLHALHLGSNGIDDKDVETLARSVQASQLHTLVLANNGITDRGALALAGSTGFRRLARLDLSGNRITEVGVRTLAESPHFPDLVEVDLLNNRVHYQIRGELSRQVGRGFKL